MARVPDPVAGLVFRYGYVWLKDYLQEKIDPVKDRPACIIARVAEGGETGLIVANGEKLEPGDVIVLPITTTRPDADALTVELTADDKRGCGLDPEYSSWVVVSEFNADIWPNADLSLVPGTERFDFGIAAPGLKKRIAQGFREALRLQRQIGVKR